MPQQQSHSGVTRRRRRLSDQETQRRMLDAALATVEETGLTVSLEHLSFEDVIRDAGVSRSAVYRRWPHKEEFFGDLLRELAKSERPAAVPDRNEALDAMKELVRAHADWLTTAEGRRDLMVEMLRVGGLGDVEAIAASAGWRTYIGLQATYLSLADGELRDDIQGFLAESERALITRVAETLRYFGALLGYRVRPELHADFETVAALGVPTMRGAVITMPSVPELGARTVQANPFGGAGEAEWSPVVVAMTSIVVTYLEPDPAVRWDEARVAEVVAEVTSEA